MAHPSSVNPTVANATDQVSEKKNIRLTISDRAGIRSSFLNACAAIGGTTAPHTKANASDESRILAGFRL
jgi:hypothetical protein